VVGTTSPPQTVTLTNTGNATLNISSATVTPQAQFPRSSNTCSPTLAAGASCTFNMSFAPTTAGTVSGSVTFTDNAPGSPQTLPLTRTGTVVSFSTSSVTFGTVSVGSSATQTVTLTNVSTKNALSITSITITGANAADFSLQPSTCGSSVPAGGSCQIPVTFAPLADGSLSASISVADNGGGSPQTVSLAGTGSGSAAIVTVSPTSLNFGSVNVGSTSTAQTVTLSNIGNANLTITSIAPGTSNYGETNTCGSSLAAGSTCTISVTFTPGSEGTLNDTLTITDNASTSPQKVSLTGVGLQPIVSLSPTSLSFDSVGVGSSSTLPVTLTNSGNATLNITGININAGSSNYSQTNTCGSSLAAGANCMISVTFTPSQSGTLNGTPSVADNATGSPQTVTLTGTSGTPAARFPVPAALAPA